MPRRLQVTFYTADPARLAAFWAEALGYRPEDPPAGYDTWPEFLGAMGIPPERWNERNAVHDPEGRGPRIHFYRMDVAKAGLNRVHLDVTVTSPEMRAAERRATVDEAVERLERLGAKRLKTFDRPDEYFVSMADPEGNEFCVQ